MTPGCTTATRLTGSISRISFIATVESTIAPSTALAAPASPVRAPCGDHRHTGGRGDLHHRDDLGGAARADDDGRHAVRDEVCFVPLVPA